MIRKMLKYMVFTAILVVVLSVGASALDTDVRIGSKSEVDVTNKDDGYVKVHYKATTAKRLKVKTSYTKADGTKDEYTYDLNGEGKWETFSLQSGDGSYTIQVLENVEGTRYTIVQTVTVNVKYSKENAPFLIPIQNVNYSADSGTVKKAAELCENAGTDFEKVEAVYKYIVENIKYDYDKARKVANGTIKSYLPVIDSTLETSKGICFDFSSVLAAMLRSQGIPTKLTMGYVEVLPNPVYHAWNEVYIKDVGWIEIRSSVYFDGESWSRMDSTFAAGNATGVNSALINDNNNYSKNKEY